MIEVTIFCDRREDPAARDARSGRCASLDGAHPTGQANDVDTAAAKARDQARDMGWRRAPTDRSRTRMGWICGCCAGREE